MSNVIVTLDPSTKQVVVTPTLMVATGPGVPSGGATGQVLTKVSNTSLDTAWQDPFELDVSALAAEWNDGATTFTGIGLDITDTASAADSLLTRYRVGGATMHSVRKDGLGYFAGGLSIGATDTGLARDSAGVLKVTDGGAGLGTLHAGSVTIPRQAAFSVNHLGAITELIGMSSDNSRFFGTQASNTGQRILLSSQGGIIAQHAGYQFDMRFGPLGAQSWRFGHDYFHAHDNVAHMRNGLNPQAFHLYNTYTGPTEYERGFMRWNANILEIGTEAAGAGVGRQLRISAANDLIFSADGADRIFISNAEVEFRRNIHPQGAAAYSNGINSEGWKDLWLAEVNSDPADPVEGHSVLWQSNGTGSGEDGDIMMKITAGGVTKTVRLVEFATA